jgi:hypothetical protein
MLFVTEHTDVYWSCPAFWDVKDWEHREGKRKSIPTKFFLQKIERNLKK